MWMRKCGVPKSHAVGLSKLQAYCSPGRSLPAREGGAPRGIRTHDPLIKNQRVFRMPFWFSTARLSKNRQRSIACSWGHSPAASNFSTRATSEAPAPEDVSRRVCEKREERIGAPALSKRLLSFITFLALVFYTATTTESILNAISHYRNVKLFRPSAPS